MAKINCIAIFSIICMLLCYKPVCGYLRNVKTDGRKNFSPEQEKQVGFFLFAAIMATGFLIRIVMAGMYRGYEADMNCFTIWSDMVYKDGFAAFYKSESFTDYPPGYMYILYVVGAIRSGLGLAYDSVLSNIIVKMPAIICDILIGGIIYKEANKKLKEIGSAILTGLYVFCPLVILDSAVWGQTDAVFTLFVVLMCYLVAEKRLIPAYYIFAVGILIKPQTLIFTPVLLFGIIDHVFLEDFNWNKFFKNLLCGVGAILMIGLFMLPFGFTDALKQYTETLGSYEYASVNAYNIWTMLGLNWVSQDGFLIGLTYKTWGMLSIIATVAASLWISLKCKHNRAKYYYIGAFIVTCVFTFSVRMHERYIFPAAALLILSFAVRQRKEIYRLYIIISTVAFYNVAHVLFVYDPNNFDRMAPIPIVISIALLLAVVFMFYVTGTLFGKDILEEDEDRVIPKELAEKKNNDSSRGTEKKNPICPSSVLTKMTKTDYIALAAIMAVYSVIAFVRLGNMSAPETNYSVAKQGEIVLDMGQDVTVSKMWDFLGYKNNPKYYVDISSDGSSWTGICGEGSEWDAGAVFAWNEKELNVTGRYIKIYAAPENTEDSIHELVLQDAEGNMLMPLNSSDYAELFDEQDFFDGRKSYLNSTYFDEIYHGRTAYEMIHHLYCYENTHPPLGKVFIALGVLIFGMNPFGWRVVGTVFGILMIPIIYNFAKKFFKESWISIVTTLLFTFDFMHFVQTRIATIDVYVTLFIMLSYYFMYCYTKYNFFDTDLKKTFIPLGLCGIAMGFSWASKWTGIYSSVGLAIIFFWQMIKRFREYAYASGDISGKTGDIEHKKIVDEFFPKLWKTIGFCCVFFVVIPVIIYLMSYIPFNDGTDRGFIEKVIQAQKTMFDYHSQLDATHDFGSKWYQWPIMYRPMWYYSGEISSTLREGISAFGNPLVWWAGIPASLYMLWLIWKEKDKKAAFLIVGYLSQYAPWFIVTRVVFIYHYFPSVPFITVMVGYGMKKIVDKHPSMKKLTYVYAACAIGLFILFYPVLSGKAINPEFATKWLKWFESWVLLKTW